MGHKHGGKHDHGNPKHHTGDSQANPLRAKLVQGEDENTPQPDNLGYASDAKEKPSNWWAKSDWWTAIGTVALALFAIGSFILLWKQLNDTRETFAVDQRPWVTIGPDWPEGKAPNGMVAKTVVVNTGEHLQVPIKIVNTGKTPALRMSYAINIEIVKREKEPLLGHPENPSWRVVGSTLFPNVPEAEIAYRLKPSKPGEIIFNDLTPSENEDIAKGDSYMAVYGEISYWDGFGIDHWTHFCAPVVFANKTAVYNYRRCTEYNTVDTNR